MTAVPLRPLTLAITEPPPVDADDNPADETAIAVDDFEATSAFSRWANKLQQLSEDFVQSGGLKLVLDLSGRYHFTEAGATEIANVVRFKFAKASLVGLQMSGRRWLDTNAKEDAGKGLQHLVKQLQRCRNMIAVQFDNSTDEDMEDFHPLMSIPSVQHVHLRDCHISNDVMNGIKEALAPHDGDTLTAKKLTKFNVVGNTLKDPDYDETFDDIVGQLLAGEEAAKEEVARGEAARLAAASLLRPLTEEEQGIVNAAMDGNGPPGEVLAKVGTDSVQRQALHSLRPSQWLNDEVIHYFYGMLQKRDEELCRLNPNRKRSHFFKSFFMTNLLNKGNSDASLDGKYTYDNVKRWSKKVPGKDIFELDKIFFPINEDQVHYMCAVISMTEKKIYMYDSMGSSGTSYLESLFQYIQDEHQDKKGVPLPDITKWELVGNQPGTPLQQNGTLHFCSRVLSALLLFMMISHRSCFICSCRIRLWCIHVLVCRLFVARLAASVHTGAHSAVP